jgi:hypothetical protein
MMMEIHVLAWDRHTNMAELIRFNGTSPLPSTPLDN